jgi:hypothetical protein
MMLAKIGPFRNLKLARVAGLRSSSITSVPVMSEGIRSGVNWMRLKLRFSASARVADHQGLGQARHADQQRVTAQKIAMKS